MDKKELKQIDYIFSDRLKYLRNKFNLSQQQLSEAIKIERSKIARFEITQTSPDPNSLVEISSFFGVSIDYLLGKEDYPDYVFDLSKYYGITLKEINEAAHGKSEISLREEDKTKLNWFRSYQALLKALKELDLPNYTDIVKIIDKIIQLSYKEEAESIICSLVKIVGQIGEENNIYALITELPEDSIAFLKNFLLSLKTERS